MKKLALIVPILSALFLMGCDGSDTQKIEKFSSLDGNFSLAFPGEPEISQDNVATAVGDVALYSFIYQEGATKLFMASYSDFPSDLVKGSSAEDLLQGGKSGQLGVLEKPVIEEESKVDLKGNAGLYFKANDGTFYIVAKDYLVGNRLYQLVVMGEGAYPTPEESSSFLDSFELLK